MEIDVTKLFRVLLKGWKIITLTVVVFLAVAFVYTEFFATPMYKSTSLIYVRPGDAVNTTAGSVTVARDLVPTYRALIDSDQVMSQVKASLEDPSRAEKPHYKYSISQIRSMKAVTSVEDTEVVKVTVTCADPHDAQLIVDQIIASSEPVITTAIRAEAFQVIDWGTLPSSPSSPNMSKNLLLAFLAAMVLSCGGLILNSLLDKRIKDQQILTEVLSVPVIGIIPDFEE